MLAVCRRQYAGLDAPGKQSNQKQLPVDVNVFPEKKIVLCSQDKIPPRASPYWQKPGGGGGNRRAEEGEMPPRHESLFNGLGETAVSGTALAFLEERAGPELKLRMKNTPWKV